MPNPYIRYNGDDRPYVQYELPELKNEFISACIDHNLNKVEDIHYELSHRKTKRAKKFQQEIEESLDRF